MNEQVKVAKHKKELLSKLDAIIPTNEQDPEAAQSDAEEAIATFLIQTGHRDIVEKWVKIVWCGGVLD